jgi:hypothetical protein
MGGNAINQDLAESIELESSGHHGNSICTKAFMTIRMRRWILISVSLIVFFLVFATVWYEMTFYERAYAWLTPGTTKAEVPKHFGKPRRVEGCRPATSWEGDSPENPSMPCVEEFSYTSHISIGEWMIRFDKNGTVISKGYSSSP